MAQYFFINKNSELPYLRMELIDNGVDTYDKFHYAIQNTDSVTFSMWDAENGVRKISNARADIVLDENSGCEERYLIEYKWNKRDVDEPGTYKGLFKINFNGNIYKEGVSFPSGTLIMPIEEDLIITVMDDITKN